MAASLDHLLSLGMPLDDGLPILLQSRACLRSAGVPEVAPAPSDQPRRPHPAESMLIDALAAGKAVVELLRRVSPPHAGKAQKALASAAAVSAGPWAAEELLQASKALAALGTQLRCSSKAAEAAPVLQRAAVAMEVAAEGVLPRILCLHGSYQSGEIFSGKLKMLQKRLRGFAVLHFVDAPHIPEDASEGDPGRCWWQKGAQRGQPHPHWAEQWAASQNVLWGVLRDAESMGRPFDGVLGFSNGAAVASMLLASHVEFGSPTSPRFAILCAGYLPVALQGAQALDVPSLHVVGNEDEQIPLEQARPLQQLFLQSQEYLHDQKGHLVPQRAADCEVFVNFIRAWGQAQRRPGCSA